MMKRFIFLLCISFILQVLEAQQGSPLLTHFAEDRNIENQSWAICQDDNQVMLFANRKGINTFDGEEWKSVKILTIPYAMQKNPADNRIYIGGENNYGYLEKTLGGSYKYNSLSTDSSETGLTTRIFFSDKGVWFYGEQSIIRYNPETNRPDLRFDSEPGNPFTGMIVTPSNIFINVRNKGLFRIESDTLFPIVTGYLTEKLDILFALPYNKNLVLAGLSDGNLSLFDGIKYYPYRIKDDRYIKENILSEGIVLGDTAFAFSTLDGGAIVTGKVSGKVLFTINNQNELPDDEIFAIGSDNGGGLWLSHQYGLTRADLNLPVENFTIFPGLKGNLSSALTFNNELYVATSEGVYYLNEVRDFTKVNVLVKKQPDIVPSDEKVSNTSQDQTGSRKNIFNVIFGKKTDPGTEEEKRPVTQYTRKTVSKLKSINHQYKKIDGLNEKCRQLVSTPNGILAATNKGLFNIKDHKASLVVPNRYINFISWIPLAGYYYVASSDGYFILKYQDRKWKVDIPDTEFFNPVYSVIRKDSTTLWLGGDNAAYRVVLDKENKAERHVTYKVKRVFPERYLIDLINDSVFLFTESAIHYYNIESDSFEPYKPGNNQMVVAENYFFPLSNQRLVRKDKEWLPLKSVKIKDIELSLLKLFDDVIAVMVEDKKIWVVDGNKRLYSIDRLRISRITPEINVFVKSISNDKGTAFNLQDVKFKRGDNVIIFDIVAPVYLKQGTTQYQYFIYKIMPNWSEWSVKTHYEKAITRPGEYILQVRAKDIWGNISNRKSIRFTIKAPLTKTPLFYILSGLVLFSLIILIVRFRERQLRIKTRLLEERVKERTSKIEAQKEEITSSIEYAGRIQRAMLPVEDHFKDAFSDYFILFKPRDIVSGDFYWIGEDDKHIFFTVADCTGHGVPGAFMSTMGISTLNEIIANNRDLQANTVLNLLREKTKTALHQTGKFGEANDGMDIAFCVISKTRKILQYSGAFNPLLLFQGGELKEYRADRMPIGIHYGAERSFTNYVVTVSRGDTIYIYSDGFSSQFGGAGGTKYKASNLKKLLSEIYYRPMVEQRNILENEFTRWKGSYDQVDDITIIGVRV
ncbi:MAG: SpoIIE family protein phosphatase [Bacteroidales bacterium]|jgi:serine phosphatase RsbU (regulator of sigma subunit)|nr:SpoIIE family protein phosphatase [Bacteroidales bacterium]